MRPERSLEGIGTQRLTSHDQLRRLERRERLGTLGNWAFGLCALSLFLAVAAAGFLGLGNPKYMETTSIALAAAGLVRWAVAPLIAAAAALALVGALLRGLAARKHGAV